MGYLDETASAKMATSHKADAAACKQIAARLANMGVSSKAASSAIAHLIDQDAVPDACCPIALPSMFTGAHSIGAAEQAPAMVPSAS